MAGLKGRKRIIHGLPMQKTVQKMKSRTNLDGSCHPEQIVSDCLPSHGRTEGQEEEDPWIPHAKR
jgi:hypothetical protein